MDDNFLYQNRPPVRPGFSENLYARITNDAKPRKGVIIFPRLILRLGVVCLVGLGVLFSFSQPARASVLDWIKQVAGLEVQETNIISVEGSITIQPTASGSLDDIFNDLPFEFAMPSYVPAGFIFENSVDVHAESVFMTWHNSKGDQILMQVDTEHGQRYLTGIDTAQELQINGQPALLIQGGYLNNGWDSTLPTINIIQRKGDLIYWLIYIQKYNETFDETAWRNELAHMMSSLVDMSVTP